MAKIVLLTSGQPSLNPRLVKEADSLVADGHDVLVIYQYWNEWGTIHDRKLLADKKWKTVLVAGEPKQGIYLLSRLIQKTALFLYQFLPFLNTAKWAIARSSFFLYQEVKKHPADLYIGHNLGALAATVKIAKKNKVKSGFDAEDFHRYENSNDDQNASVKLNKTIENKYFPKLDYLSAASPLIAENYHQLFPDLIPVTINNLFPRTTIKFNNKPNDKLKLFWFSQTIGKERGIEDIIAAIGKLDKGKVELHLLGNYTIDTQTYFNKIALNNNIDQKYIYYYEPIPAENIFEFAAQFDIGMATETGFPFNREICLTNKVFTYLQSGLAIIASDTLAQVKFMEENELIGSTYQKNNIKELANKINYFLKNTAALSSAKETAYNLGQQNLNWEHESKKFLVLVNDVLKK